MIYVVNIHYGYFSGYHECRSGHLYKRNIILIKQSFIRGEIMGENYLTYLKYRGDLLIEEAPFNDIDNLILSELSYFDFSEIVREDDTSISLKDACQLMVKNQSYKQNIGLFAKPFSLLNTIADTKRYGTMKLSNFINRYDEKKMQFAAVKIQMSDHMNYISFRGTDDTLTGWKEDFSISFEIVPSQKAAADYLNQVIDKNKDNIIGGHSKGGHLAVYDV